MISRPSIVTPPTSSIDSRCAASLNVSPFSTWPPGTAQYPFSGRLARLTRRIFPRCSTSMQAVSCSIMSIKQVLFTNRRPVSGGSGYCLHHAFQSRKPLMQFFLVLSEAHHLDVGTGIYGEVRLHVLSPFPYGIHYLHGWGRPIYNRRPRRHHGAMHFQRIVFRERANGSEILAEYAFPHAFQILFNRGKPAAVIRRRPDCQRHAGARGNGFPCFLHDGCYHPKILPVIFAGYLLGV